MGARAESLAKQYEAKAAEMTATIEKLSDADWKKVTSAEKWPVGVTAHHVAGAHEAIAGIVKTVASGQAMPNFTMAMLDEMNAKHAVENANCTKAETLEIHKKGVTGAAAVVRGLSDGDLDKSGTVLAGMPAMSVQQIVEGILINHVQEHLTSIKSTVGTRAAAAGA
jgi:mycothiol maleylpyruvate isomerase-like protein